MEVKVNDENFKKEALESELPCLVDFWAEWCMPCRMIAPTVKRVAEEYEGKLKVCKLNVDEAPKIASEYSIMIIPTLAIFKNGKIQDKVIGIVSKSELEAKIKPFLK